MQAAAKVIVSLPLVTGLAPNVTVKPEGKPDAASEILPVNPPVSATVIVPEAEPQSGTKVGGKTASEKPPAVTVSEMLVVAVNVPEVPVTVIGYVPATVVEATLRVRTLDVADDVGLKAAVTPVGMPDAVNATLPVNGLTSVTVMVSVALAPAPTDSVAAEGFSVKLPRPTPPQAVPLIAKFAGTALAEPFHVPLNPIPVRLPPAAMLPL